MAGKRKTAVSLHKQANIKKKAEHNENNQCDFELKRSLTDASRKTPVRRSERPEIQLTASVLIGCRAKTSAALNGSQRDWTPSNCAAFRTTENSKRTFNRWKRMFSR